MTQQLYAWKVSVSPNGIFDESNLLTIAHDDLYEKCLMAHFGEPENFSAISSFENICAKSFDLLEEVKKEGAYARIKFSKTEVILHYNEGKVKRLNIDIEDDIILVKYEGEEWRYENWDSYLKYSSFLRECVIKAEPYLKRVSSGN